ncbi:MAG: type II secretion system F family protein [archaeon]
MKKWPFRVFIWLSEKLDKKSLEKLGKDLEQAGIEKTAEEWFSLCFFVAFIAMAFFLCTLKFNSFYLPCSLLAFAFCFYVTKSYPGIKKKMKIKTLEKEMPHALRLFSLYLDLGLSFEKILDRIPGEIGKEFLKIKRKLEAGAGIREAFETLEKYDSDFLKKSAYLLILTYNSGIKSEALKKTGEEQTKILQAKLQEYNHKLVFYSLILISTSAIIPAFFQAFAVVGGVIGFQLDSFSAFLIPAVIFPVLNLLVMSIAIYGNP